MNFKIDNTLDELDFNKFKLIIKFILYALCIFQIVISDFNLNAIAIVLLICISTNLLLHFTFNKKNFIFYFFPTFMLFSINFVFITGPLIFQTFFFQSIVSNLSSPVSTFLIACIYQIVGIFAFSFYLKSNLSNLSKKITKKILVPMRSFQELKVSHVIFLLIVMILIKYYLNFIDSGINKFTEFGDVGMKILYRISSFYYIPLVFFFKFFYVDKTVNKTSFIFVIFTYVVAGFIFALSSNGRTDFFEILFFLVALSVIINFFIMKKKKSFSKIIILSFALSIVVISSFISNTILENRKIRNNVNAKELFFLSLNNLNNLKPSPTRKIIFGNMESYTGNKIIDRFVNIKLMDYTLMVSKKLSLNQRKEFNDIVLNRYISIFPQPFINIFNKNFSKAKYVISTTSIIEKVFYGDFRKGILTQGSFLIELQIIFNSFVLMYIVIFFLYLLLFIIVQSFQNNTNTEIIMSPLILCTIMGLFRLTHDDSTIGIVYFLTRGVFEMVLFYFLITLFIKNNYNKE